MPAATQAQQNLNSVMLEDVLDHPDQIKAVTNALKIITDDREEECPACGMQGPIMSARALARAKAVPKDLLPTPSQNRTIIVGEDFIITEKGGERTVMKATKEKQPTVRRTYKVQG